MWCIKECYLFIFKVGVIKSSQVIPAGYPKYKTPKYTKLPLKLEWLKLNCSEALNACFWSQTWHNCVLKWIADYALLDQGWATIIYLIDLFSRDCQSWQPWPKPKTTARTQYFDLCVLGIFLIWKDWKDLFKVLEDSYFNNIFIALEKRDYCGVGRWEGGSRNFPHLSLHS